MSKKFVDKKKRPAIYGITSQRRMELEARASNRAALNRAKSSGIQYRYESLRLEGKIR